MLITLIIGILIGIVIGYKAAQFFVLRQLGTAERRNRSAAIKHRNDSRG